VHVDQVITDYNVNRIHVSEPCTTNRLYVPITAHVYHQIPVHVPTVITAYNATRITVSEPSTIHH